MKLKRAALSRNHLKNKSHTRRHRKSSGNMSTMANGSSCSNLLNPTAEKIGHTFAFFLILVVSLVGNSFIVTIVYRTPNLRKPINYFIANMAMSDLLYPIFLFPLEITRLYVGSWLIAGGIGLALCKLLPFFADISTIVSILSVVLIAVDRFGAVVVPLRSPLIGPKLYPFFIITTWIVAMAVHSPYLFAHELVENRGKLTCRLQWNNAFGESSSVANYFLAGFIVFFYIPVVLLAILYSVILVKLKTQVHPGEFSANAEEQRTRRNGRVLKMAIAIVLGFVFCWVPFTITVLLRLFAREESISCGVKRYSSFAWFMAYGNCAINPIICFVFSSNYRQGLKRLLRCFSSAAVFPAVQE